MSSFRLTHLPVLVLAGLALSLSAAAQEPQMSEGDIGDTLNVEIKIVPFYAVDEKGNPVLDLKQEEIEVRIDGKPIPIDTFDAFEKTRGATTIPNEGSPETPSPALDKPQKPARRHVVLFFDMSFSNQRGFESGRKFAEKMVKESPSEDLLYLVTHDFKSGLKQRLGPMAANEQGKSQLLAGLKKLKPEAGFLDASANWGGPLVSRGSRRNNIPQDQNSAINNAVRTNSQSQLEGTARSLAESMQALAEQFQRINEPKLMVFLSQGIDRTLYWEGSDVGLQFSGGAHGNLSTNYQYRGLHTLYEKPMQQLAETGTMSLFVNLDDHSRGAGGGIGSSMQHMARISGGLYLGDVDPAVTNQRVAKSTGAYYEAGFYLGNVGERPARSKVEVLVKRPGVHTWSAGTIKARETWRGLSEDAQRLLIVDLVEGDAEAQRARSSVRLDLRNLPGNVLGRSNEGKTMLRYEVGWPRELAGRKIDLYNVVIEPTRQVGSPNILHFDKQGTQVDGNIRNIDVEVPEKATFVWGIVAIEPATGKTWYRRFHLQGKQTQK
jgi:VWFA-related protein